VLRWNLTLSLHVPHRISRQLYMAIGTTALVLSCPRAWAQSPAIFVHEESQPADARPTSANASSILMSFVGCILRLSCVD